MEIIILARNVKPNEIAPKVKLTFIQGLPHTFSEITGPFELKFHMEIFFLGHLRKMATMPIYGKKTML